MKNATRTVGILAFGLLLGFLIAFAVLNGSSLLGFVGLPTAPEPNAMTTEPDLAPVQEQQPTDSKTNETVSSQLFFDVILQTQLKATQTSGELRACPQYNPLSFEVQNIGSALAERLFVKYPESLVVQTCANCRLKELKPKQKTIITLTACNTKKFSPTISFSSINAAVVTIHVK